MIEAAQQRITTLERKVGPDAKSPLFAQLASYYLENNRAQDALRICDAGLANYPFYTTGHLIKGKALVSLSMIAEARREFEFVLDFLPNNETVKELLAQAPPGEEETVAGTSFGVQPEEIAQEPEQVPFGYRVTPLPATERAQETRNDLGGEVQPAERKEHEEPVPERTSSGASFFEEITHSPAANKPDFLIGSAFNPPPVQPPAIQDPSPLIEFQFPHEDTASSHAVPEPPPEPSSEFDFALMAAPPNSQRNASDEEPFEQYAARKKTELSGEETVMLDEYFNTTVDIQLPAPDPASVISPSVQNKIEELANKLQSAGRITPVINFVQKETPAASEQDTPAGMGFVTPTLAEIYAKQGWYDDAIKAYKTLARSKPADKDKFEKRILELEQLRNQSPA